MALYLMTVLEGNRPGRFSERYTERAPKLRTVAYFKQFSERRLRPLRPHKSSVVPAHSF